MRKRKWVKRFGTIDRTICCRVRRRQGALAIRYISLYLLCAWRRQCYPDDVAIFS